MLIDLDKHGEFEKMRFPAFHKELLSQSYWNAGDDLGRIKVVISEGFSREQQTYPFDRIKNIVSFSFQHAPLGKRSSYLCGRCHRLTKAITQTFLKLHPSPGQMLQCGVKYLLSVHTLRNSSLLDRGLTESKFIATLPVTDSQADQLSQTQAVQCRHHHHSSLDSLLTILSSLTTPTTRRLAAGDILPRQIPRCQTIQAPIPARATVVRSQILCNLRKLVASSSLSKCLEPMNLFVKL